MKHEFEEYKISIYEPFSEFLLGTEEEKRFDISLLDVVRFAGHACPSMIGAFLISQRIVQEFYPDTGVCVRGEIEINLPTVRTAGATGPIANVFGFIFGSWSESGFGGLNNMFVRRNLLRFANSDVAAGTFQFRHLPTSKVVVIKYSPELAEFEVLAGETFQQQWRRKIKSILRNADKVIQIVN